MRLTSWLFTKRGGVEFRTTEDKSIQWQGEDLNLGSPDYKSCPLKDCRAQANVDLHMRRTKQERVKFMLSATVDSTDFVRSICLLERVGRALLVWINSTQFISLIHTIEENSNCKTSSSRFM